MKKLRDGTLNRWERETMLMRKSTEMTSNLMSRGNTMILLDRILDLIQRMRYERLQPGGK